MKKLLAVILLLLAGTAWGGDFEDGNAAYQKRDYSVAISKYKLAAEQGNFMAQYNVGNMYNNGEGVVQDYAEAVKWYKLAAAQGTDRAQFSIGNMYLAGKGVVQDYAEAAKWYKLAAAQGFEYAQLNIGNMYYDGLGVEKNYAEALKWYKLAAAKGNAKAQKQIDVIMFANERNQCYKACQRKLTECVISYKSAANEVCGMPSYNCNQRCDSIGLK